MNKVFLICVLVSAMVLGAPYATTPTEPMASVDYRIITELAPSWVDGTGEVETAIAISSASGGGGTGTASALTATVGSPTIIAHPYPVPACKRVYEGGSTSANGYIIKLKDVLRKPTIAESAPISEKEEILIYPRRTIDYVTLEIYDSSRKLLKTMTLTEGQTLSWETPSGDKLSIRACDIYYSDGYYPKPVPMPIPEPEPMPVPDQPDHEAEQAYGGSGSGVAIPEEEAASTQDSSGSSAGSVGGGAAPVVSTDAVVVTDAALYPQGTISNKMIAVPEMPIVRPLSWASLDIKLEKQVEPCICTLEYAPVCGTDGKTYSNGCMASCAGVKVAYKGACKTECPDVSCYCREGTKLVYEIDENGCKRCKCIEEPPECPENCVLSGNTCVCKEPPVCPPGCVLSGNTCSCPKPRPILGTKITLHRQHRNCVDDSLYEPAMGNRTEQVFEVGGDTGYWNFRCSDRKQEQCYSDGSFDTYYYEWCEFEPTTSLSSTTVLLSRETRSCRNDSKSKSETFEVGGDTGYWNFRCSDRKQEQCYSDGSFDKYYYERCTFLRREGVVPVPTPLCAPGCKASGTTCVCPLSSGTTEPGAEVVPVPVPDRPRELTEDEVGAPSTRVSILNYELGKTGEGFKEALLASLESDSESSETKRIIEDHLDYVLEEKQGRQASIVNVKASAIKAAAIVGQPETKATINVVRKKMLDDGSIREMLVQRKSIESIMQEMESQGSETTTGGLVVGGKAYVVSPVSRDGIKGKLFSNENGVSKQVGEIDVATGQILEGTINIYNKLLGIVSQ